MKKKTKPGAIQQLLSYAGNNKKQLYLSTLVRYSIINGMNTTATLRELP